MSDWFRKTLKPLKTTPEDLDYSCLNQINAENKCICSWFRDKRKWSIPTIFCSFPPNFKLKEKWIPWSWLNDTFTHSAHQAQTSEPGVGDSTTLATSGFISQFLLTPTISPRASPRCFLALPPQTGHFPDWLFPALELHSPPFWRQWFQLCWERIPKFTTLNSFKKKNLTYLLSYRVTNPKNLAHCLLHALHPRKYPGEIKH